MNPNLKPVFEEHLHHGPSHHGAALWTLRFRVDCVAGGIGPVRSAFKRYPGQKLQRIDFTVREGVRTPPRSAAQVVAQHPKRNLPGVEVVEGD